MLRLVKICGRNDFAPKSVFLRIGLHGALSVYIHVDDEEAHLTEIYSDTLLYV